MVTRLQRSEAKKLAIRLSANPPASAPQHPPSELLLPIIFELSEIVPHELLCISVFPYLISIPDLLIQGWRRRKNRIAPGVTKSKGVSSGWGHLGRFK